MTISPIFILFTYFNTINYLIRS